MTDWSSRYNSSSTGSGGGTNWASRFNSGSSSGGGSSGGGFWDDITGAVSHQLGRIPGEHYVAGRVGAAAGVVGSGVGQGWGIIHGIPSVAQHLPGAFLHNFGPHGNANQSLIDLLSNPGGSARGIGRALHDPKGIVGASYLPIESDVSHARHGDLHYFAQHPLNPILDVASIASLGGGGALRLARLGTLGERAAAVANEPRLLRVGDHAEELSQSRTLQGRIRQQAFDRYSEAHPDMPLIGANQRMKLILNTRAASQMLRARIPVRHFQRITGQLTKEERFAYHVAAEGVPLEDRIAFYQAQIAERPTSTLRKYLKHLESDGVARALQDPRPQFVEALQKGKDLEESAGQRLMATGQLSAESRAERAALPQDVMRGKAEMGTNPIHPDLPAPFRFWHSGGKGSLASQFSAPKTEGMLGKAAPLGQTKHSLGVRLRQATFETDPERVLTQDYLSTMRHEAIVQMQREALDPISRELSGDLADYGFKGEGEFYYRPSYDRKTTAPVAAHVRQRENLARDRAPLEVEAQRQSVQKGAEGIVSQDIGDLVKPEDGLSAADLYDLEKLKALGIRRVPAAFGKDFAKEFGGTPWAVRVFFDRPLDVWRAITLNLRPAWAVNNLFGNALMGLASHPGSAAAYLRTLRLEKGDDKVMQLWKWTKARPTLRRKYGAIFQEVAPDLHSAGLFGTQTKITNKGVYEGRLAGFRANPAVRAIGFTPRMAGKIIMGVGRGITKAEVVLAEDTGREAVFINAMGGDIAKIRAASKKMGEGNVSLADALKRLDRPAVERGIRAVNDALGDFNQLSPTERSIIRRVIPFYSWYKVITKVSAKYAARYPARLLLLHNIEQAQNTDGEPALPSWLVGSLRLGKPKNGTQSLISTTGINPYETIPQTMEGGFVGAANPLVGAGIIAASGRDTTFGNLKDYYGVGATSRGGFPGQAERFGGALVGSLAPVRLIQGETQPYQGKLYDPKTYHRNLLLQYLGIPIRDVKLEEAKRERGL